MQPLVTVAIPTYNRKKFLKETLDSIVCQDYSNFEVFISDNHSEDGTDKFVHQYILEHPYIKIRYYRQDYNKGAELNWKNCYENACGEFIIVLSDDDLLERDALSNLVQAMDDETVFVIGNMNVIDECGMIIGNAMNPIAQLDSVGFWKRRLTQGFHDTPSSVMHRTKKIRDIFPIAQRAGSALDLASTLLLSMQGKVKSIQQIVAEYRVHNGNDSGHLYRCSSSHVSLNKMFEKYTTLDKMQRIWLRKYCILQIVEMAFIAFRKERDILLMMRIVNLLNWNNFHFPLFIGWLYYMCFFSKRGLIKLLKILRVYH